MEQNTTSIWKDAAAQWIAGQGDGGDTSRRLILDPCLDAMLMPDVSGKHVLDVGCGEGRYCRKLAKLGAIVAGVDPVDAFIERARLLHPGGQYVVGGAESLPFGAASFDVVLTYLTLVDIPDYRTAIAEMSRVLRLGGKLYLVTVSNMASSSAGWEKDAHGNRLYRTIDRYMDEFPMDVDMGGYTIVNFHRPLSSILERFFANGFVMDAFEEPLPPEDHEWYSHEFRVPTFQIMRFSKDR